MLARSRSLSSICFSRLIACSFLFCASVLSTSVFAADSAVTAIKVDQVGYLPRATKIALVTSPGSAFLVRRSSDGSKVFEGKLSPAVSDHDTGDTVASADFTSVRAPGSYYVEVPGVGRSYTFAIQPDIYSRAYYLATRAFYGQRCGTAVDMGSEFPGYSHPACHEHGEFHGSSGRRGERDNVGGWHDAGDYGRYVVNSGISTGALMWAWEMNGEKTRKVSLNIPESGNGTPDLLSEVRWNLTWMLKMQDDDGGAWHKQASEHFSGFVMPQEDKLPSVIVGTGTAPFKSTCATADLAAVAAIAGRVYKPYDAEFAARNLKAARAAWGWVEQHPNVTFKNPPGIGTGEYGDDKCGDEMLWAAAELWRTTGDESYNRYFFAHRAEYMGALGVMPAEDWREVGAMGLWTYALGNRRGSDEKVIDEIRKATVSAAHRIVEQTRANPYHVSLLTKDYVWGSNGVAASYGMELIIANSFAPDPAFIETSLDNLHYLLGRNTFSLSWVAQLGSNPFRHPHHRPSGTGAGSEAHPWPGMLSGGPNAGRQDPVMAKLPAGLPPARNYVDDYASYASNEIAINWQAMLVFLTAAQLP
jgi:endoglucanase